MKYYIKILSWLLHHANREYRNEHFYAIKNRVLKKHGRHIGYDVQFIEGKKCWSCIKGVYHGWDFKDICWHCGGTSWYKRPVWNILSIVKFGKYTFHQPFERVYKKPDNVLKIIEGYIEHSRTKYGSFARTILFLLYEKGYIKRWWKTAGMGWRTYWWRPSNYMNNIIHLLKKRHKSIPITSFIAKVRLKRLQTMVRKKYGGNPVEYELEDIPF